MEAMAHPSVSRWQGEGPPSLGPPPPQTPLERNLHPSQSQSSQSQPSPSQYHNSQDNVLHSSRIPAAAREQPTHCPAQTFDFDWREHGLRFIPPPPPPNLNTLKAIPNIRFNEFDSMIIIDGSYQGTRNAENYRSGGAAFIIHVFDTKSTFFGGKHLSQSQPDNSAPVSEAEATLMAFKAANTLKLKNPLCIHDNQDMTNFLIGKSSSSRHGNRYAQLKDQIKHFASKFNTASCSHIYSHDKNGIHLDENIAVDLLAIFFRKNPNLSVDICRLDVDINQKLRSIFPRANDYPFITCSLMSSGVKCTKCGSPGHNENSCFMLRYSCIPKKCVYTIIQPPRVIAFNESFNNPGNIDWTTAPPKIDNNTFVHFISSLSILITRQVTTLESAEAFNSFNSHYHYNYIRRKVERTREVPIESLREDEDHLSRETLMSKIADREAKKILNLAKLCEIRHWKKAMQFIHKEERVSPFDPRVEPEWNALHPDPPNSDDELQIPYNPSSYKLFQIDREIIKKKIASWDVTNASGLTGLSPALIIHFYNLTARDEDPAEPNPHFTAFLIFIEHLASGRLSAIRDHALNYRSVIINKNPPEKEFKARNISIGDAFIRLATYAVLTKSIEPARHANLLSDFDLGNLVKNGVEKFVRSGQLAANEDCVIFSCDMTKGYNNILRTITWKAIQQIDYEPLTQLFIFLYGESPHLNYIDDPTKPATNDNVRRVKLGIGLPQGDSLSGFLFSITINYVSNLIRRKYPNKFVMDSILDDVKVAISRRHWPDVSNIISDLIIILFHNNFHINLSKSELFAKIPTPQLQQQVDAINRATVTNGLTIGNLQLNSVGFSVCRVPIGSPAFITQFIQSNYHPKINQTIERFKYLWKAIERIPKEKFNTLFVFIRLCYSSRFLYWLRTLNPIHASPIALIVDKGTEFLIEKLYPQIPECFQRNQFFCEQMHISKMIQKLPLSKGGAGITKLGDILHYCHIASMSESLNYISEFGRLINVTPDLIRQQNPSLSSALIADRLRERLYPGFRASADFVIAQELPNFPPDFFAFDPNIHYSNIQKSLTSDFHNKLQATISASIDQPSYKGWFEGNKEQYSSFTLNSQVRHITHISPPSDKIFRTVLSMRVLRPLFLNYSCRCGCDFDLCGHHALRCQHTSYTSIHHSVRHGCMHWMEMYIRRQFNSPMKCVSEKQSQSQCKMSHYYLMTDNPTPSMPTSGRQADGILFLLHEPMHPWAIDFVQIQTNSGDSSTLLRDLNKAYNDKIRTYQDTHPTIPTSRIIPFVFTSNGTLHPKTEEFMDWFICNAASQQLQSSPSNERISFRHAFLSALQDKTAFAITSSFEAFIKERHMMIFPNSSISVSSENVSQSNTPSNFCEDSQNPLITQHSSSDTHPLARLITPPTLLPLTPSSALPPLLPPAAPPPASNHSMCLRVRSSSLPPSLDAASSLSGVHSVKAFFDSLRRGPRRGMGSASVAVAGC
jgi:hypothetical protein